MYIRTYRSALWRAPADFGAQIVGAPSKALHRTRKIHCQSLQTNCCKAENTIKIANE